MPHGGPAAAACCVCAQPAPLPCSPRAPDRKLGAKVAKAAAVYKPKHAIPPPVMSDEPSGPLEFLDSIPDDLPRSLQDRWAPPEHAAVFTHCVPATGAVFGVHGVASGHRCYLAPRCLTTSACMHCILCCDARNPPCPGMKRAAVLARRLAIVAKTQLAVFLNKDEDFTPARKEFTTTDIDAALEVAGVVVKGPKGKQVGMSWPLLGLLQTRVTYNQRW
jgi:hypothetical protein